jgi:hypothetical protein
MTSVDQLTSKLLEIINQIQSGIVSHAPDAIKLVLAAVQQDGIANILPGIVALIVLIICVYAGVKFYKKWEEANKLEGQKDAYHREDTFPLLLPIVPAFFVGFICFLFMCPSIFSYWNYVEIFNPKVYLAHEIIQKVVS